MVTYRIHGQQSKRYARTYAEALDLKATLTTDICRGEYRERAKVTVEEYAKDWIDTYIGRTSRGFRESTREGYRYSIEQRAIPFFSKRTPTLASISPPDVRAFIASLFARQAQHVGQHGATEKQEVATRRGAENRLAAGCSANLGKARQRQKDPHNR